jgi:hypothetical protein
MAIYGGETTIHLGGGKENFLLLPIIPEKAEKPQKARAAAKPKRKSRR